MNIIVRIRQSDSFPQLYLYSSVQASLIKSVLNSSLRVFNL